MDPLGMSKPMGGTFWTHSPTPSHLPALFYPPIHPCLLPTASSPPFLPGPCAHPLSHPTPHPPSPTYLFPPTTPSLLPTPPSHPLLLTHLLSLSHSPAHQLSPTHPLLLIHFLPLIYPLVHATHDIIIITMAVEKVAQNPAVLAS